MSKLAVSTDRQTRADLAGDVAQLYMQGTSHPEIGAAVNLTQALVHKTLNELFAEGMPKRERHRTSAEKIRAIHGAYVRGDGSLDKLAKAIGLTPSGLRRRMSELNLSAQRQMPPRNPARSRGHAEQRVITALLMARVDELRKSRALSLERLAQASDVSIWTLQQLRGELTDPRLTTVLRLCRGLGVTAGELLDDLPLPIEPRSRGPRPPAERPAREGT